MSNSFYEILEVLTPQEQAEVETFASYMVARRKTHQQNLEMNDIPTTELTRLVKRGGSFDWLQSEEDIYTATDGKEVLWASK